MKRKTAKNTQSGFTLIEALVVVSIIGFLANSVLVIVNGAQIKAQNARRMAEFTQGMKALELYRQDYGVYPFPNNATDWICWAPSNQTCMGDYANGNDAIIAALQPYIPRAPQTLIPLDNSYGQNWLAVRHVINTNGTHSISLFWAYYGNMPANLCPSLLPPGATKASWAPSPPGYWSDFGDTSNYSYCWENYTY